MLILNYSWAVWLAWALGLFFVVNGLVNLAGIKAVRDGFAKWGFPSWFHIANGLLDLAAGLMIIWYPTRVFGLALAALICVGVWATLIRHREWSHLLPSLVLFAVTVLTAWGLRLLPL